MVYIIVHQNVQPTRDNERGRKKKLERFLGILTALFCVDKVVSGLNDILSSYCLISRLHFLNIGQKDKKYEVSL